MSTILYSKISQSIGRESIRRIGLYATIRMMRNRGMDIDSVLQYVVYYKGA